MAETKRTLLERIDANLKILLARTDHSHPHPLFGFRLGPVGTRNNLPAQGTFVMALTLKDNQHVSGSITATDAAGNPVPFNFPTPPTWASSDTSIVTVSASADGSNADIATTGKLGTAQITVSGTNADGTAVTGIGDLTVVAGDATTFTITFGTPADK